MGAWPSTWRSVPLWSLFQRVKDVGHPEEEMLSVYRDHGVIRKDSRTDNFNKTAENRDIYQLVHPGWLIVNRMKAWQGSLGISDYRGIVSGHYICFRPRHRENPRFLNYLLRSGVYTAELIRRSRGVRPNQIEIDNELLRSLPVRLPPVLDQIAIADFLDTEIQRIDAIVEHRNRMIALGSEHLHRRTDDICWAEVQSTTPLMHVTQRYRPIMYGIVLPGPDVDDGVHIVKGGDVAAGFSRPLCRTTPEIEAPYARARLKAGDLVITIRGGVGDVAVVPSSADGANITQDVARVAVADGTDPRWLLHVMRSPTFQQSARLRVTGATITGLNIWDLKRLRVPDVPRDEQQRRAAELEALEGGLQAVNDRLRRQLSLLGEHRQALITAAVTGQLDVAKGAA